MKKSILMICLIIAMAITFVGCDMTSFMGNQGTENNNQIINQANVNSGNENQNSGSNVSVEIVPFVSKVLEPTAVEELVTSGDAVVNAKADANKYAEIEKNPVATMVIKDYGTVTMELYPKVAPESVENFISLINKKVYDGLIFHRTIPGFMAQGGDPAGDGTGGPDYSIVGEFSGNGFENNLSHVRGLLSMARSNDVNSAGSQFFIVTSDSLFLDGQYAGFGKVLEGMDVVDKVVNVDVLLREADIDLNSITTIEEYIDAMSKCDRPVNPPVIESITVDTFGVEYDEPEKIMEQVVG